jgi:hypothetical protein
MVDFRKRWGETPDGLHRVAIEKTTLSRTTLYTHNWSDPTTWYEQSVRSVDEIPANEGDNKQYNLEYNNIIDLYHGKITGEDSLKDSDGYSYRVSVTVDGYNKSEQDPHYGSGGDYVVNYDDGYITFLNEQSPSADIKVTYYYENGSRFTIKPESGKKLKLELTEIQFSTDLVMKDSVHFGVYGLADVFLPDTYPPGTMIPLRTEKYKSMRDFYNDAVRSYPTTPAVGGAGWRGLDTPMVVLDWDYISAETLNSSYGVEIRVSLEHDEPMGGSFATATFYFISEDE